MRKYRSLVNQQLMLPPKKEHEFSQIGEVILIPNNNSKVFLHWYSKNGNLSATNTLSGATLCSSPFRILNGSDETAVITVIEL